MKKQHVSEVSKEVTIEEDALDSSEQKYVHQLVSISKMIIWPMKIHLFNFGLALLIGAVVSLSLDILSTNTVLTSEMLVRSLKDMIGTAIPIALIYLFLLVGVEGLLLLIWTVPYILITCELLTT